MVQLYVHVEVARKLQSRLKRSDVKGLVRKSFDKLNDPARDFNLAKEPELQEHVDSITFCPLSDTWGGTDTYSKENGLGPDKVDEHHVNTPMMEFHVFELNDDGENPEFMDDDDDSSSPSSHHWILPSKSFHDLWDSLVFSSDVKTRLLDYVQTAVLYADKHVKDTLITWNKVILLHGPPGTGKTSLCKALAHKAAIRLNSRFRYGQLVEINSHSLFSKWFSESGKLVMKMFDKIQELIEDQESIVFLLIDEVESLAQCRMAAESGNEPSDSIRAVNALLTQIDRIKKYPNVVVLTTSNIVGSIDIAFVDRADLKIYIGNPPAEIIYSILASSINELIRVGIIDADRSLNETICKNHEEMTESEQVVVEIANLSINLSGRTLRKLPFLTHVNFVKKQSCSLSEFLEHMKNAVVVEKAEASVLKGNRKQP